VTKIHKTKLALLSATAVFTATAAHAQVADTWTINDDVTVSAANTGATTTLDPVANSDPAGIDGANIGAGFKNSISASAVGASASSSFNSVNNSAIGGDAAVVYSGGVTVSAGNGSTVLNNNDVLTLATVAGSANSISLAAVGSSASVSGSTTLTDVGGGPVAADETFSYTAGSLTISSGDADGGVEVDQGSTVGGNNAGVSLILATGVVGAGIDSGSNNSVSVAGVGSSASASFSATVGGDGSILNSSDVTITDGATISSANSALGVVAVGLTDAGIATPVIGGGNANSISAAAVGSSASFSLASSTFDSGVITDFNATVGDLQVDSTNGATVSLTADGTTAIDGVTVISAASIAGGQGNSISASAVGSSGSVSYANTVFDGGNGTAGGEVAFGTITVNSTNTGGIANATDLTGTPTIEDGSKNSISVAGVGASASQALSVTDYSGGGNTLVLNTTGAITLTAFNTAGVGVSGAMAAPTISAGFNNSISAAAVGASASQSVARTLVGAQ